MPKTPPYSPEFRREAVQLLRSSGRPVPQLAKELGVSPQSLRNWASRRDVGKAEGLNSVERDELRRFCRENKILAEEREILKKQRPSSRRRAGAGEGVRVRAGEEGRAFHRADVQGPCGLQVGVSRVGGPASRRGGRSPDAQLCDPIAEIHKGSLKTYGSPADPCRAGPRARHPRRRQARRAPHAPRWPVGPSPSPARPHHDRRAGRQDRPRPRRARLQPDRPRRLWCADITYIRTSEGWLYLASVMDCYSRRIVGWAMADMRAELVVEALQMAVPRRRPDGRPVHHSDQGSQGNTRR